MITISTLEALDLSEAPLAPKWTHSHDHMGPVQTTTPLWEKLYGRTTCGTVTMMSGVMLWAAARLGHFCDTAYMREMAEAGFAWQLDWRFLREDVPPPEGLPKPETPEGAGPAIFQFMWSAIRGEGPWNSFSQPIFDLVHMAYLANFIMPKSALPEFEKWLLHLSGRLYDVAEAPDMDIPEFSDFESEEAYNEHVAPMRGAPIPPAILEYDVEHEDMDLEAEARAFVATLDPTKNRFLRSKDEMLRLGFEGEPYKGV